MTDELLEYVGHELSLDERTSDGSTVRDHLLSAQRQTGIENPMLVPIECRDEVKYLYEDYFLSMNRRRTNNGSGPNALTHGELLAWAESRHVVLSAFEVDVLDRIETLWLDRVYSNLAKARAA